MSISSASRTKKKYFLDLTTVYILSLLSYHDIGYNTQKYYLYK